MKGEIEKLIVVHGDRRDDWWATPSGQAQKAEQPRVNADEQKLQKQTQFATV
jgi:hypothetical protein